MREKASTQTLLDIPSPSTSTSTSSGKCLTEIETPLKSASSGGGGKVVKKKGKKVDFSSPPKWRTKHTVGGGKSVLGGKLQRAALKPLQSNTAILVGRGSLRIPPVGKGKESKLRQSVITCTSPPVSVNYGSSADTSKVPVRLTTDQGTQTEINVTSSLDYRMCTEDEPPSEYWYSLAEQRREALAETLQENEELYVEVDRLKKQITELESQVKDLEYFAMMYKLASAENS